MVEFRRHDCYLDALDGSSLLGFLAALGTLRSLALVDPLGQWLMRWMVHAGVWMPVISSRRSLSRNQLVGCLATFLRRDSTPEFDFARNLSVEPEEFRTVAESAQKIASPKRRNYADFVASFGTESHLEKSGKKIQDTALRTMSGAGHQHFLGTMKKLVEKTDISDLKIALFGPWIYSEKLGLRWDPEEDRRYALRWNRPASEPAMSVRGANRLAVEALPILSTTPGRKRLETTGFSQQKNRTFFTWPLWTSTATVETVRSLLTLGELQEPKPDRSLLAPRGIAEVLRCERITEGKFRNFTRSEPTPGTPSQE